MTVDEALIKAQRQLAAIAQKPRMEAEILLAHTLECSRIGLHARGDRPADIPQLFWDAVNQRKRGRPIEYITGSASFYALDLSVGEGVLIPRPETELLVDAAARIIASEGLASINEVGIGSGAVSIMLAEKFPRLSVEATDISVDALVYAQRNIRKYGLEARIQTHCGHLLEPIAKPAALIVSNPPYIAADYPFPEPLYFEPLQALVAEADGCALLFALIDRFMSADSLYLACEMGHDQRQPIQEYCRPLAIKSLTFYKDYAGWDRGFIVKK